MQRITLISLLGMMFIASLQVLADPKVVLVTGALGGLGKDIAEKFAEDPEYRVYATGRNLSKANFSAPLFVKEMDVSQTDSVNKTIGEIIETEGKIDIVINNAAYAVIGDTLTISEEQMRNMFEVNTYGPFRVMSAVLPYMVQQKSGYIFNISSTSGFRALPGLGVYAATKFALEGMTEAAAIEYAPRNISFTLVQAGSINNRWSYNAQLGENPLSKWGHDLLAHGNLGALLSAKFKEHAQGAQDPKEIAQLIFDTYHTPSPHPLRIQTGRMAAELARERLVDPTGQIALDRGRQFLESITN